MESNTASPVASSVSSALRVVWWLPLLRGLVLIVLGVLIMMEPLAALKTLAIVVGLFLLVDGLIVMLDGWLHRSQEGWKMWLIQGAVDIVIAIILLAWPSITVGIFFYLLIIWTITLGVVAIIGSAALARNKDLAWPWLLAFGLVSVMFGVMLLMRGQDFAHTLAVVGLVLSIYAFIAGSIQIVSAFSVRAMARDIDQALKGESSVLSAIQERQVSFAAQNAQRAAEREAEKEAERQQREVEKAQRAAEREAEKEAERQQREVEKAQRAAEREAEKEAERRAREAEKLANQQAEAAAASASTATISGEPAPSRPASEDTWGTDAESVSTSTEPAATNYETLAQDPAAQDPLAQDPEAQDPAAQDNAS